MTEFFINPIGIVNSPFEKKEDAPSQGWKAGVISTIIIKPELVEGLSGLTTGQDIFVLCWFDRSDRNVTKVHRRGNPDNPLEGVFSTRSPARPNPVSLTLVTIVKIEDNILTVKGLDALNETPVVDIKPAYKELDKY